MFDFDLDDYLQLPSVADVGDYTFAMNLARITAEACTPAKADNFPTSPRQGFYYGIGGGGASEAYVGGTGGDFYANHVPAIATEYTLVVRRSGTAVTIWIDGLLGGAATRTVGSGTFTLPPLQVGGFGANLFIGPVGFWKRAWSDTEIADYAASKDLSAVSTTNRHYYMALDAEPPTEAGGASITTSGTPTLAGPIPRLAEIAPGWPQVGPSGNTLVAVLRKVADGTPTGVASVVASGCTLTNVTKSTTVNLAEAIWSPESADPYVFWALNEVPVVAYLDDGAATLVGTWTTKIPGDYAPWGQDLLGGSMRISSTPSATATYSFTGLAPGTYDVYRTGKLIADADRTTDASYTVKEGATTLAIYHVDQTDLEPDWHLNYDKLHWSRMGTVTIAGTEATVTVANAAGSGVLATDAVMLHQVFERFADPGDTLTFDAPDAWCTAAVGFTPESVDRPVTLATDEEWFPYDAAAEHPMEVGYNLELPSIASPSRIWANMYKAAYGWETVSGSTYSTDAYGTLTNVSGEIRCHIRATHHEIADAYGIRTSKEGEYRIEFSCANTPAVTLYERSQWGITFGAATYDGVNPLTGQRRVRQTVTFPTNRSVYGYELGLSLTGSGASDCITGIKIYDPDVPDNWDKYVHPYIYDILHGRGFRSLRFLDCNNINNGYTADFGQYPDPLKFSSTWPNGYLVADIAEVGPVDWTPADADRAVSLYDTYPNRCFIRVVTTAPHGFSDGQVVVTTGLPEYPATLSDGGSVSGSIAWVVNATTLMVCGGSSGLCPAHNTLTTTHTPVGAKIMVGEDTTVAGAQGVSALSIDDQCHICNDLELDLYIQTSHCAKQATIRSVFNRIGTVLAAGRKIRYEVSNETWNSGIRFKQYDYYQGRAREGGFASDRHAYAREMKLAHQYAFEELDALGRGGDLIRVMAGQELFVVPAQQAIAQADADGTPIDELAIGAYQGNHSAFSKIYGGNPFNVFDRLDIDGLVDLLGPSIHQTRRPSYWQAHRDALDDAEYTGTRLIAYEGGMEALCVHGTGGADSCRQIARTYAASVHPRIRRANLSMLQMFEGAGCRLYHRFYLQDSVGMSHLNIAAWADIVPFDSVVGPGDGSGGGNDNRTNYWDQTRVESPLPDAMREFAAFALSEETTTTVFATPLDLVQSTLASGYTAGATSIPLAAGTGALFGTPSASEPIRVTITPIDNLDAYGRVIDRDLVASYMCTGRSTDTLTGLSLSSGSDQDFPSGSAVWVAITSESLADIHGAVNALEAEVPTKLDASALSAFGLSLVDDADAAAARATLGLVIDTDVLAPDGDGGDLTYTVAGTGAVPRTTAEAFGDRFNVRDRGAAGDGTADDTAEIQAAINAAQAAGGGEVYLPRGAYRATGTLTISQPYIRIKGDGKGATKIIKDFDTGNLFSAIPASVPDDADDLGLPGLSFTDFWIEANGTAQTGGHAIYGIYTRHCEIRNVRIGTHRGIQGAGTSGSLDLYDGIFLDLSACFAIRDNEVFVKHRGVGVTGSGQQAGAALPLGPSQFPHFGYNGIIAGNTIYNKYTPGSIGIHIGGGCGGVACHHNDVGGWETSQLIDTALRPETNREVFLGPAHFLDAAGNRGLQVGANALFLLHWVDVWAAGAGRLDPYDDGFPYGNGIDVVGPNPGLKVVLDGGRIYGCAGAGIQFSYGSLTMNGVAVHNNGQGVNGGNGIDLLGGASITGATIVGCTVQDNGQAARGTGINVVNNTSGFTIAGNTVTGNAQGQIAIGTGCDNFVVAGNTPSGTAPLANGSGTGTTKVVTNNAGIVDPAISFDGTDTYTVGGALKVRKIAIASGTPEAHFEVQALDGTPLFRVQTAFGGCQIRHLNPDDELQRGDIGVNSDGTLAINAYDDGAGNALPMALGGSDVSLNYVAPGGAASARVRANATGLGLNGATPVAQSSAIANATDATDAVTKLNTLLAYLRSRGDIAT